MNFRERAIQALNQTYDGQSGQDAIGVVVAAMQDARDDAFMEAGRMLRENADKHAAPIMAAVLRDQATAVERRRGSVSR